MNLKKAHHLYIGLLLIIIAIFLRGFWHYTTLIIGVWLASDDIGQEIIKLTRPDYQSPVNILFHYLWEKIFGTWWPFGEL